MGRLLRRVQTAAADRTRLVQHPRLYRQPIGRQKKGDWVDGAFKWGLFTWLMWMIWAPVLLGVVIVLMVLL